MIREGSSSAALVPASARRRVSLLCHRPVSGLTRRDSLTGSPSHTDRCRSLQWHIYPVSCLPLRGQHRSFTDFPFHPTHYIDWVIKSLDLRASRRSMCGTPKTDITIPWRAVMSIKTVFTYQNRGPIGEDRSRDIDSAHDDFDVKQRFKVSCLQRLSLETRH